MPDVDTPEPLGDHVEALASGLFDPEVLGVELTLKCRYLYLHGKMKAIQRRGEKPKTRWVEKHSDLESRLREKGISPSDLIGP